MRQSRREARCRRSSSADPVFRSPSTRPARSWSGWSPAKGAWRSGFRFRKHAAPRHRSCGSARSLRASRAGDPVFSKLREPGGGYSLLMIGLALLALAGLALPAFGPVAAAIVALAGAGCAVLWWSKRSRERYDLSRLWDAPLPEPDEPVAD